MNKHNGFWAICFAATLALAGCGVQEPDDGGSDDGTGDDHTGDQTTGGTNGWDTIGQDAGSGSTDTPTSDGGAPPATDAGSTPTPSDGGTADAGAPPADAGSPTPDAGSPAPDAGAPAPDAGTPPMTSPAPFRSPSACQFRFADAYIGGAGCGQIRGNLPGATWSSGPVIQDSDLDHELEVGFTTVAVGTYELTYVSETCRGGTPVAESWAAYGSRAQLLGMTEDARSFVNCNWWDAATGMAVTVSSPGCNLRIAVDATCHVTGAGNMRNYH